MNSYAPDTPLHVFVSSTAEDLAVHREKVVETIQRLGHLPVAMETFPAAPETPVSVCRAKAAAADVMVVMVAHRYGYVPSRDQGGDGESSMTRLEVEAARDAGRPVLAFLVDENAPWDQPRDLEEIPRVLDDLGKVAEIAARLKRLRDFREDLSSTCVVDTFTTPDDLAARVAAALARQVRERARPLRPWVQRSLVMHALQRALHFRGRNTLVRELTAWVRAPSTGDRVVSLVAAGGTGKTALAEHVLAGLGDGVPAGLLVWSFYDDQQTEEFLRVACEYFGGDAGIPIGERLERLQQALAGGEPHLLVLDGLERVQAEGRDHRPRGMLDDPQIKRLLRFLAAGAGTGGSRARALVTSRYPLVDLEDWDQAGHRTVRLEDLDVRAARGVLRGWGVHGGDRTLDSLAEEVHRHALTVAVLGSYLGNFCGGDPAKAPTFDRGLAANDDVKAAKLARVLDDYADALDPAERALLARLAAFPRGVGMTMLTYLVEAGGRLAGALAGFDETRLTRLAVRLGELGLVSPNGAGDELTYTAHPFLREYFEGRLDVRKRDIHEAVLARLAPRLATWPKLPAEPALLDSYERYIEHARLADRPQEAFDHYWHGLGGYSHLSKWLGENERGLRIVMGFSPDGTLEKAALDLPEKPRARLLDNWGLYAKNLGDLATARRAFELSHEIWRLDGDAGDCSAILQDITDAELLAGRLVAAREAALKALRKAQLSGDPVQQTGAHAYLATALAFLGEVRGAQRNFAKAGEQQARGIRLFRRLQSAGPVPPVSAHQRDDLLISVPGVQEAEFHLMCGRNGQAEFQLRYTRAKSQDERSLRTALICDTLLGRVALADDPVAAGEYLDFTRAFGAWSRARAKVVEIHLRSYHLAAELALRLGRPSGAADEAREGILLADGCGFGKNAIDLRLVLARACLEEGDLEQALVLAGEALERSAAPECQYAWGQGDALHLTGAVLARQGEIAEARKRLIAAAALRERLEHPRLDETRAALLNLGAR